MEGQGLSMLVHKGITRVDIQAIGDVGVLNTSR